MKLLPLVLLFCWGCYSQDFKAVNVFLLCRGTWAIENMNNVPIDVEWSLSPRNFGWTQLNLGANSYKVISNGGGKFLKVRISGRITHNVRSSRGQKCVFSLPICVGRWRLRNPTTRAISYKYAITSDGVAPIVNTVSIAAGSDLEITSLGKGVNETVSVFIENEQQSRKRGVGRTCNVTTIAPTPAVPHPPNFVPNIGGWYFSNGPINRLFVQTGNRNPSIEFFEWYSGPNPTNISRYTGVFHYSRAAWRRSATINVTGGINTFSFSINASTALTEPSLTWFPVYISATVSGDYADAGKHVDFRPETGPAFGSLAGSCGSPISLVREITSSFPGWISDGVLTAYLNDSIAVTNTSCFPRFHSVRLDWDEAREQTEHIHGIEFFWRIKFMNSLVASAPRFYYLDFDYHSYTAFHDTIIDNNQRSFTKTSNTYYYVGNNVYNDTNGNTWSYSQLPGSGYFTVTVRGNTNIVYQGIWENQRQILWSSASGSVYPVAGILTLFDFADPLHRRFTGFANLVRVDIPLV